MREVRLSFRFLKTRFSLNYLSFVTRETLYTNLADVYFTYSVAQVCEPRFPRTTRPQKGKKDADKACSEVVFL